MKKSGKKMSCRTKELPKRLRLSSRMKEIDQEPPVDTGGLFVFVRFEDGYTAKIFSKDDILHQNEDPVLRFDELQPGENVLARWTDGNLYNATVEYIKSPEERQKVTGDKRRFQDAAAARFYASSLSAQHFVPSELSAPQTTENVVPSYTSPPLAQISAPPKPPYSEVSCPPHFTFRPSLPSVFAPPSYSHPEVTPVVGADYISNSTISSPRYYNLSASQNSSCIASAITSVTQDSEPLNLQISQGSKDLPENAEEHSHQTPQETFFGMLLSTKPSSSEESFPDASLVPDCGPVSEHGESATPEYRPWKPCTSCKQQVSKLMEENQKMAALLSSISIDQVKAIKTFCDSVEQYHQSSMETPASGMDQQELYPGCQLYISSFTLAAIHQSSQHDCLRLFHLLFEHFFTEEECVNSVVFGRHGQCPNGKEMLDQAKVKAIMTYVMRFSSVDGWKPVELGRLKKAFINKCRHRSSKLH